MNIEDAKEELSEESKKIVSELDGKSKEEIKAMEDKANAELHEQIYHDATEYVYNLLALGKEPYSPEVFAKFINDLTEKRNATKPEEGFYSNFDDNTCILHEAILRNGYSIGGKAFVEKVISEDPESAKVLFETAIQRYMELSATIEQFSMIADQFMKSTNEEKEEK